MKIFFAAACFLLISTSSGFCDRLDPAAARKAEKLAEEISNPTAKAYGYAMIASVQAFGEIKGSNDERKSVILKRLQDKLEAIDITNTTSDFQTAFAENTTALQKVRQYNSDLNARMLVGAGRALSAGDSTTKKVGTAALSLGELIAERDRILSEYMDSIEQLLVAVKKQGLSANGDPQKLRRLIDILDGKDTVRPSVE